MRMNHNLWAHPLVDLANRWLFGRRMFHAWEPIFGLSAEENERAIEVGYRELRKFETSIRHRAREVIDQLEAQNKLGIVMLGRPYHHDPGINHEIPEQFQKLGYPIFSQSTLPLDEDLLDRLFGEEVRARHHPTSAGHLGCVEDRLLGQFQPRDLGRQVHRPPSEPGGSGDVQLQVRPRRTNLQCNRADCGTIGHSLLLL